MSSPEQSANDPKRRRFRPFSIAAAAAVAAGGIAAPASADGPESITTQWTQEQHLADVEPHAIATVITEAGPWYEAIVVTGSQDGQLPADADKPADPVRERKITVLIDGYPHDFYTSDPDDGVYQTGMAVSVTYSVVEGHVYIERVDPLIS